MTITAIQTKRAASDTGNAVACTLDSAPTNGNTLVIGVTVVGYDNTWSAAAVVSSVSQSNVTWNRVVSHSQNGTLPITTEIWYGVASASASTSLTVNFNTSGGLLSASVMNVREYSGLLTSSYTDKTAYTAGTSSSTYPTGTTDATTQANELWIGVVGVWDDILTDPSNGFTLIDGATGDGISVAYLEKIVSATAAASSSVDSTYLVSREYVSCIATFKATAGYYPYIQQVSDVDSVADIGTHSSFAAQQAAADSTYDTLTEADTDTGTSTIGKTSGTGSSYRTTAANEMRLGVFTASSSGEIQNIHFYGRGSSTSQNCKAIITDSSGNILTNGVGDAVSVSTTAGDKTLTFTNKPKVVSGSTYWVGLITAGAVRIYYDSTTGATSKQDTSNSYTTPTNPTDAGSTTETWRIMYANINNLNYQLQLEEQFTDILAGTHRLHVKTGAYSADAEALNVEVWDGDSWESLGALTASTDNDLGAVDSYISGGTLTIRFHDATTTNDVTQSTWQIDSVFLVTVYTKTFTINATLEAGATTYTATFTVGANLAGTLTKPLTVNANLLQNLTKAFSAGGNLLAQYTKTFTVNGSLLANLTKTFTVNGGLLQSFTKTFTVNSNLLAAYTKTFSAAANLQGGYTVPFTTNAELLANLTKPFTVNGNLLQNFTKEFTLNGNLLQTQTVPFTTGANLLKTFTAEFTYNCNLSGTLTKEFTFNAELLSSNTAPFTINSNLTKTVLATFTLNAELEAALTNLYGDSWQYYYSVKPKQKKDITEILTLTRLLLEAFNEEKL